VGGPFGTPSPASSWASDSAITLDETDGQGLLVLQLSADFSVSAGGFVDDFPNNANVPEVDVNDVSKLTLTGAAQALEAKVVVGDNSSSNCFLVFDSLMQTNVEMLSKDSITLEPDYGNLYFLGANNTGTAGGIDNTEDGSTTLITVGLNAHLVSLGANKTVTLTARAVSDGNIFVLPNSTLNIIGDATHPGITMNQGSLTLWNGSSAGSRVTCSQGTIYVGGDWTDDLIGNRYKDPTGVSATVTGNVVLNGGSINLLYQPEGSSWGNYNLTANTLRVIDNLTLSGGNVAVDLDAHTSGNVSLLAVGGNLTLTPYNGQNGTGCRLYCYPHNTDAANMNGSWQFLSVNGTIENLFGSDVGGGPNLDLFDLGNVANGQRFVWHR
jgi:hypothetical protein